MITTDSTILNSVVADIEAAIAQEKFFQWLILEYRDEINLLKCKYDDAVVEYYPNTHDYTIEYRSHPISEMYWVKSRLVITIGKRAGLNAFRVVNLARHKRNRKPKFITFGSKQHTIDEFTRWKLTVI